MAAHQAGARAVAALQLRQQLDADVVGEGRDAEPRGAAVQTDLVADGVDGNSGVRAIGDRRAPLPRLGLDSDLALLDAEPERRPRAVGDDEDGTRGRIRVVTCGVERHQLRDDLVGCPELLHIEDVAGVDPLRAVAADPRDEERRGDARLVQIVDLLGGHALRGGEGRDEEDEECAHVPDQTTRTRPRLQAHGTTRRPE